MYNLSRMEKWITNQYLMHNIIEPENLNFDALSIAFEVTLYRLSLCARYDIYKKRRFIVVDSRCSIHKQREQFFHELCHILFHEGHQSDMYEPFRKLLEREAERFVLYAALPYHIIKYYNLASETIIYDLSSDFQISEKLCHSRLKQIKSQIHNSSLIVSEQVYLYNA